MRPSGREYNQIRSISMETNVISNANASCMIKLGNTQIICTASVDDNIPKFLKGKNTGWVTAEYGMLPASTTTRIPREAVYGKQSGRTIEIQRLIGRALRQAVDLRLLGARQIYIDCDVINADGGTRTAAITGAYVALHLAIRSLIDKRVIRENPLINQVAAISCGIYKGKIITDLDYDEDNAADVDTNFVFNHKGNLIEMQGTGERSDFTTSQLLDMIALAANACTELFKAQTRVLMLQ